MSRAVAMPTLVLPAELRKGAVAALAAAAWRTLPYVLLAVGVWRIALTMPRAAYRNDFAHYYLSAQVLLRGENPYTTPLAPLCQEHGLEHDPRIPVGTNPPLLTAAVALIAPWPLPAAYAAWAALQMALLCALILAAQAALRLDGRGLLLAGVALNATCVQRHFLYSQVQLAVAACLAAALVCHLRRRRWASCALATLAACFKLYPAVFLPWFLLHGLENRRDLLRRGLAVAAVGAAVLAATGLDAWRSFFVDGLPVINRSVDESVTNYSLRALVATVVAELTGRPVPQRVAVFAAVLGKLLAAAVLLRAYVVVGRRRLEPVAAFGVLTVAMIAASPVCWSHYLVLMILPVAGLWRDALPPRWPQVRWTPLVVGALCLWPELDWFVPFTGGLARVALHFYPLAALGVAAVLLTGSSPQAPRGAGA